MMKLFQQTDFKIITKHCTDLIIKLNQNQKKEKRRKSKNNINFILIFSVGQITEINRKMFFCFFFDNLKFKYIFKAHRHHHV